MTAADRPVLVVDNFDSFVYNLVQYLGQLGVHCIVRRNDAVDIDELADLGVAGVLLSPGPGTPAGAGVSVPMVRAAAEAGTPVFGVCLGHQAIAEAFGAEVGRAPELLHGKTSQVVHRGDGVLAGLPSPFTATRYHSLAVDPATVPAELEVTGATPSGVVMALRHRELPVEGVSSTRSRCSPRAATACWPPGWRCVGSRRTPRWSRPPRPPCAGSAPPEARTPTDDEGPFPVREGALVATVGIRCWGGRPPAASSTTTTWASLWAASGRRSAGRSPHRPRPRCPLPARCRRRCPPERRPVPRSG